MPEPAPFHVAALTGGLRVPSARFRVRQYGAALLAEGIVVQELVSRAGAYPPARRMFRPAWAATALGDGFLRAMRSRRYDACLLQRELVSTLVTFEPLTRRPRILDVDDAIFVYRQGSAARRLAELSDRIICGNAFLAEWFGRWNRNVAVIPTAVDASAYVPRCELGTGSRLVVGWIGTWGNLKYLAAIEVALARVLDAVPDAHLLIVSDRPPRLDRLPAERVEYVPWSAQGEIAAIQGMDVGVMPLEDSVWARGKCSFKMLQYMACGLPVVVSPVGMNAEVLSMGRCGFGPVDHQQWTESLLALLASASLRSELGYEGRKIVEAKFSIPAVTPQLARCLRGH
jgi:glycosyltransferase involved in cell wall biosynthesis